MLYASIENDKIKNVKKLQNKKYRDELGLFIVEGEHIVAEAYKAGVLKEIYSLENFKCDYDVEHNFCNEKVMKYSSELDTYAHVIGICKKTNNEIDSNSIIALDNIQDPGNLGTIIRSAVAFGIDTILLSKDSVDIYNSKVIRATQGMLFNINVVVCDLEEILKDLRNKGFTLYGTKESSNDVKGYSLNEKRVIVFGNEGNGISEGIISLCDEFISIKMTEKCESLNVAVAASIIMHEMFGE